MKRVLLATDGSTCAEEAAWFLSHLPHAEKLDLTVLSVLQIPYVSHRYLSPNAISESVDRERASSVEAYGRIEKMFEGANVTMRHVSREGDVTDLLLPGGKQSTRLD